MFDSLKKAVKDGKMNYKLEKRNEKEYFEVLVDGVSVHKGNVMDSANSNVIMGKIHAKVGLNEDIK